MMLEVLIREFSRSCDGMNICQKFWYVGLTEVLMEWSLSEVLTCNVTEVVNLTEALTSNITEVVNSTEVLTLLWLASWNSFWQIVYIDTYLLASTHTVFCFLEFILTNSMHWYIRVMYRPIIHLVFWKSC